MPTTTTFTDVFLAHFKAHWGSTASRIHRAIRESLEECPTGGWVNSDTLANWVYFEKALKNSPENNRSYVQYILINSDHVCRHGQASEGGYFYNVHPEVECSTECNESYKLNHKPELKKVFCPECFLQLPSSGECGNCV